MVEEKTVIYTVSAANTLEKVYAPKWGYIARVKTVNILNPTASDADVEFWAATSDLSTQVAMVTIPLKVTAGSTLIISERELAGGKIPSPLVLAVKSSVAGIIVAVKVIEE